MEGGLDIKLRRKGRWCRPTRRWRKRLQDEGRCRSEGAVSAGKAMEGRVSPAAAVASWPAGGMDEAAPSLFSNTFTDPQLERNIIHTVSFLSTAQFCEKGSTRADYSQFDLSSAPTLHNTFFFSPHCYMYNLYNNPKGRPVCYWMETEFWSIMTICQIFRATTNNKSVIIFLIYCLVNETSLNKSYKKCPTVQNPT